MFPGLLQLRQLNRNSEALTPVPPRERVATLDVLRGCALLGVLLANLYALYSFRFASRRVLVVIAPVGRMPLTTYLMQSLICTSLFYGWGLGWRTPPPAACIGLGLAIFAVQIAHAWLRWFRFGPAEWLWRSVVYGQLPLMR